MYSPTIDSHDAVSVDCGSLQQRNRHLPFALIKVGYGQVIHGLFAPVFGMLFALITRRNAIRASSRRFHTGSSSPRPLANHRRQDHRHTANNERTEQISCIS
jgi:hypothetical protein